MLQDAEGFDPPYGGESGGEMLPPPELEPAAPPQPAFVPEPPPWQDALDAGDLDLAQLAPPADPPAEKMDPVSQLKIDTDDAPEIPAWGPPVVTNPAPPIRIPEPDWEAELAERAEQHEPEPTVAPGPPLAVLPPDWKAP
jgi:hypothetical protein